MKLRAFIFLVVGSVSLRAQTFVWSGNGFTSKLSEPLNWVGLNAPSGSTGNENLQFGDSGFINRYNPLVFTGAFNSLTFIDATRLSYTFSGDGGPATITLNSGISVASGAPVTFDSTVTLSLAAGNHAIDVTGASTGLTFSGLITGSGSVQKTGTGTLTLTGLNTYTGSTAINGGTVSVDTLADGGLASGIGVSSNAPANLVLSNGGTLSYTGSFLVSTDRLLTVAQGGGTIDATTSGGLNFTNPGAIAVQSDVLAHAFTLTGTSAANTFSPVIVDGANAATFLQKTGTGSWVLYGANTYTGGTTVSQGILFVANANGSGTGSGSVAISTGATLVVGLGGAEGSVNGGIVNDGALIFNRSTPTVYSGTISGIGLVVQNPSTGVLTLAGSNTYSGQTEVGQKIIDAGANSFSPNSTMSLFANAILGVNFDETIHGLAGANLNSTVALSNNATLSINESDLNFFYGAINGNGALLKIGAGETDLMGPSTYTGATIVHGGILGLGTGGSINNNSDLTVGEVNGDNGTLKASGGVVISTFTGTIGNLTGSTGTVSIAGANTSWTTSNSLFVGRGGSGQLDIASGGVMTSADGTLGELGGSSGSVTIQDSGSKWITSGDVVVGKAGFGSLNITNGGIMTNNNAAVGASSSSTTSRIFVSGAGSSWNNAGHLYVGNFSNAAMQILNGGFVTNSEAQLGSDVGVQGSVTVDGAGSVWANLSDVFAGVYGHGELLLSNGGVAHVNSGAGLFTLGNFGGSTGTVDFGAAATGTAGAGGTLDAASITTGGGSGIVQFNTNAGAANPFYLTQDGTLGGIRVPITGATLVINTGGYTVLQGTNSYTGGTQINGGELVAGSTGSLGTGVVTLNGGNLNVANSAVVTNSITFGANGGVLSGNGTFGSAITIGTGATLSPGNSPGTLSFTNGLTLASGGTMNFQVESAAGVAGTGYDLVSISGGTLDITASNTSQFTLKLISLDATGSAGNVADFNNTSNYSWTLAISSAGINNFAANKFLLDTSGFTNSLGTGSFTLLQGMSNGNPALVLSFASVPEPSTYALMFVGLGGIGLSLRRRSSSRR